MRVLVVEDERKVADAIQEGLQAEHYDVVVERTGEDGYSRVTAEAFDLVLLDLGLPGLGGLEVLTRLRNKQIDVPVLVITARDGIHQRVVGLDAGADDYLVKPFAFDELLARMRALIRRGRSDEVPRITTGALVLDRARRQVTLGGKPVELTVKEFDLLEQLMRHQGQVVSREALARDIWREFARTTPIDNVIDVHIARLRRKIDDGPVKIQTVRGVGFMLTDREP
jgi:two-component system, OmpR family, copper resistance phosphate regulon response regulator CusR